MVDSRSQRIYIACEADIHGAVMQVYSMLSEIGTIPTIATEVATAVSELAMNIVKYAGTFGNIFIDLRLDARPYIEVIAEDKGHGITNVERAVIDHYSTKGTLGVGLPGVKRMMDEFEIVSQPGRGARVRVKKWLNPGTRDANGASTSSGPHGATWVSRNALVHPGTSAHFLQQVGRHDFSIAGRPCLGEIVCGDGAVFRQLSNGILAGIIDVLGHGKEAHELARFCEDWLSLHLSSDVESVLCALHGELKGSLGAAVSLAYISAKELLIAGVGNTIVYKVGDQVRAIPAQPGIVGGNFPRLRPTCLPIQFGDTVLLATDGISSHIDDSLLIARCRMPINRVAHGLLRDFGNRFDDATCLAMRCQS